MARTAKTMARKKMSNAVDHKIMAHKAGASAAPGETEEQDEELGQARPTTERCQLAVGDAVCGTEDKQCSRD